MQEKVKLDNRLSKFKESLNKNALIRLGFYIFTIIAIVLKGALFLGFSLNQNIYTLNFGLGYRQASYFINYYIAFAAIFVSICFLFKNKGKFFSLIIVDLFITLITVMDIWYFRGFQTVPSVMLLKQTANLDNLGDSIFSMASPYDLLFFVDFIILIIAFIIFRKSFKNCKSNWKGTLVVLLISICYIGYVPFNVNVLKRENVRNSYLFSNYDPTNTVEYFSPIGYHIFDVYNVYKNSKPYKMTAEDEAKIKEYYDFKNENLPDNEFKGMFKGKNLIVIQVESLEDFVINKKVDGQEITPNINKLLNNSIYLPNIFEQVNEGTSSDSDLMVNTSMLPLRQGSTFFRNPATTYNSLPNILEKDGYSTIAIHSDKGSFWNYAQGLNGIGFDKFVDYYSFDRDENIGLGLSDGSYFRQIEPMIKELKQPFYAFTVTLTSHGPFDLPKEYRELKLSPELDENVLGGYFQSIHYTDAKIGMFIESLKKDGLLDNTVIAIEGDHTGPHKYYNSKIESLSNPESWWLDNGNHTVPLIIYNPSIKTPVKDDVYGGQIDIMPTLLYLLGVDNNVYQNTALGRNLLNTKRSYAVLTDKTIKGELTDKEKEIVGNVLDLSDKMIRADYFKDKIPNDTSKNN
ncbi:LTA synthase family protein [Clostridium perfringens]|uniref:LTA synthase family protein n=1 Tax=Clostridium perfringens TaxID=1502 RepID=UPI000BBAB924|nr:LTA synthase family protein [Clostridium perfringens]MDM0473014.1 LTA synthase family protein [Clostridium perfringens]MDM0473898.1 LTA synthase family protein [Clostridium perfringens]MDM0478911.1 LTA synthase family protein [Clostridium perfringens]MDM0481204.1 LTA synthase family protein [Clostridium perfringens]MDM0481763.1 LTA synthase family protein [Clostridium perfringens]